MAFKILASRLASDNTLVAVERDDLGDPRKVLFHPTPDGGVTYGDYFRFARQLFSTENITNNPGIFGQARSGANGLPSEVGVEFSRKFLEKVPAELHEFGCLVSVYHDSWDNREVDTRLSLTFDSYSHVLYGQNYGGQTVRLTDDMYWGGLILFLSGIKDFFAGSVWSVVQNLPSSHQAPTPANAFFHPARLMNGTRYIIRCVSEAAMNQGTQITAGDAMELMASDNASVTFQRTAAGGYILVCPVSLMNKSSLYQLFASSTDVTSILGKGAPSKKIIEKMGKKVEVKVDNKLYGVELELSTDRTVKQMIDAQGDPVRFLCKQDASITGSKRQRYECVTVPMGLSDHRKLWTRFFANVGSKIDFDVTTQTNNGMHVHIGRTLFTEDHLQNFTWFITAPEHREFILQLSQRTQDSFDRWSPAPKYNTTSHFKAYQSCVQSVIGIRGAVNIGNTRNKPTVEVRIFKGIVSCAEVLRNLEVVDSIFEFTRPVVEGGPSNYQSLTIDNYYNWVKSTPKTQYKLLRADLWKFDIPMLVRKARTLRIIFNMTDPEKIVEKVNAEKKKTANEKNQSKRFEIDKIVFATVTRVIGRRAFGLTDDGDLEVVQKAVGRIAHMDTKLIASYDKRTKAGH